MESPATYPESPLDQDDFAYPCKGCGDILEEGKAFELAGHRWHINCFRCNTCGTLLNSDANLLLLGDGSLICNNCTYSCSSCGNKIEDLAILTGDQAFCANCFKCRNCKKKIENLRYARTTQGIFCMECHESLMARRRKKTARNAAHRHKAQSNVKLDKSLPSLPPSAVPEMSFSPEVEVPSPDSYPPSSTEVQPRKRPSDSRYQGPGNPRNHDSPASAQNQFQDGSGLSIPPESYRNNRHSTISQRSDISGGDEFLIPVAFDPTPPAAQTPQLSIQNTSKIVDERPRDYFTGVRGTASSSRKIFTETNNSQPPSPHIAYQERSQERNRPPPADGTELSRRRRESSGTANGLGNMQDPRDGVPGEPFKLQDVPKNKRGESSGSRSESITPRSDGLKSKPNQRKDSSETSNNSAASAPLARNGIESSPRPSYDLPTQGKSSFDTNGTGDKSAGSPQATASRNVPRRGDSLETSKTNHVPARKDVPTTSRHSTDHNEKIKESSESGPIASQDFKTKSSQDSQVSKIKPDFQSFISSQQQFTTPRTAPSAPMEPRRDRNESVSTMQSETRTVEKPTSPALPRYSHGGEFSMEEDMARILGAEDAPNQESFLRRVSNSVRHGRSFSDKGGRLSKEPKWPKSPTSGTTLGHEISSPIMTSPEHRDEITWYKNELRKERQKALERDQKISELESALDSTANIKQVNSELREKRSTMVVLDTQKEMVVRELEVLTEHIATSKNSGDQIDLGKVKNSILRDFAGALQRLKDSFSPQIEESIQQRNNLIDELTNLTQMKDKSFQEFELLSLKNSQLADLNNSLVQQIQYRYKANSTSTATPAVDTGRAPPNGLGIYAHHKDKSQVSIDTREVRPNMNEMSLPSSQTTIQQEEAEPITVLQGPQMVSIRKGQPKKFNWKKGGQNITKGVTKGIKGAFTSTQQSYAREMQFSETGSYSSTPMSSEAPSRQTTQDSARQGFGFFGGQKGSLSSKGPPNQWKLQSNGSSTALVEPATTLFGSDLEARTEYEKAPIPYIVSRCIEEVELRGMDVEGIYRKSGGNSQIQSTKDGFERQQHDFDVSDPDLDIHAVTSALKQYFRKLPTPLITYEVYDKMLDTASFTSHEGKINGMYRAVLDLPKVHRDVLNFLVFHLKRVVEKEKENLMTSMNVAVVFAPTIMRPESLSREMTDTQRKNEAVQFLVENCHAIFSGL